MRAVVQRVTEGDVASEGRITGRIGQGLVVLLGVSTADTKVDAQYMAGKIANLRIFEDEDEKLNLSVMNVGGSVLAVSQFTLLGEVKKGNRPSFTNAARPEEANELYRCFCDELSALGVPVQEGVFRTDMLVRIYNDGPVTILIDSKKEF